MHDGELTARSIVFPSAPGARQSLYFNADPNALFGIESGGLALAAGGWASTDTFFNIFPTARFAKYTIVRRLALELDVAGDCQVRVEFAFADGAAAREAIILRRTSGMRDVANQPLIVRIDAPIDSLGHVCFFRVEATSACTIRSARFVVSEARGLPQVVRFFFSITTFNRQGPLERNEAAIAKWAGENPETASAFHFVAVDNARSISRDSRFFRVIPNGNLGGAGGCARGMIEALREPGRYTHFVICDDDILIDPAMLASLHDFLRLLREPQVCVAGSMMRMESPCIQHEFGATYRSGRFASLRRDVDLRVRRMVLLNESDERIDYGAWWFYCAPMTAIERHGLPLPFFLRFDDVEFSIRQSTPVITLSGVGVWHDSFETKDTQIAQGYFSARNALICEACRHGPTVTALAAGVIEVVWGMLHALSTFQYRRCGLGIEAIHDFLKGPEHVFQLDTIARMKELAATRYTYEPIDAAARAAAEPCEHPFHDNYSSPSREPLAHMLLRVLTLNGHLLPGHRLRIVPIDWARAVYFFGSRRVLVVDPASGKGYSVGPSLRQLVASTGQCAAALARLAFHWPNVAERYRAGYGYYTSVAFWEKRLGVPSVNRSVEPRTPAALQLTTDLATPAEPGA